MAERDPINLIKEQLNGIEKLTGLHADHEAFQQWHTETKTILEKAFSSKTIHYQNFVALKFREMSIKAFASPEIDKINAQRYRKDLENVKNVLQGAVKELTLDRTLFKKIQTTPRTVEVSLKGEYFISSGISDIEMQGGRIRIWKRPSANSWFGSHPEESFQQSRADQACEVWNLPFNQSREGRRSSRNRNRPGFGKRNHTSL
jgi:hypothetical protein